MAREEWRRLFRARKERRLQSAKVRRDRGGGTAWQRREGRRSYNDGHGDGEAVARCDGSGGEAADAGQVRWQQLLGGAESVG